LLSLCERCRLTRQRSDRNGVQKHNTKAPSTNVSSFDVVTRVKATPSSLDSPLEGAGGGGGYSGGAGGIDTLYDIDTDLKAQPQMVAGHTVEEDG
jgi:hypothetical protein